MGSSVVNQLGKTPKKRKIGRGLLCRNLSRSKIVQNFTKVLEKY